MINQTYKSQIVKALANKDFDSLLALFANSGSSFIDLLVFYKRNDKILSSSEFWVSKLPQLHLKSILDSDLKVTFLQSYFISGKNCNDLLNRKLLFFAKEDTIKHFNLCKAFENQSFLDSFKLISNTDSEIEKFINEIDIVLKVQNKILVEEKQDEFYLRNFNIGEIMLAFTLYYHSFKQQPQVAGNKSLQTQIEVTLIDELNKILLLFKDKSNLVFDFKSNEELQKQYQRNEEPHHILGKKGIDAPLESKFEFLYNLINRLISRNIQKRQLQLYLFGYSDFISINAKSASLKTNTKFKNFRIDNTKTNLEEAYFSKINPDNYKHQNQYNLDVATSIASLNFYDIPLSLEYNGVSLNIIKALQILKHFSKYKSPISRGFFPDGTYVILNQADNPFRELFGENESITLFDYDKLVNGIIKYFNWSVEESKSTLSFLTLDINSKNFPHSWVASPFIRYKNQVMWVGSFLKDRRWDNILLNKLRKDPEYNKLVNRITKNFELKVEELFKANSFKTKTGERFKSKNGQNGDFDVLAYRDNCLFVCEAKTGARSDEFSHAAVAETVKLEGCAAEQLEKAISNIKEDWANIRGKLNIEGDIPLDSIKIIPLIVTDFFEGDIQLYKNSINKVSLLELDVIFKNKKKELLEIYIIMNQFSNGLNPNLYKAKINFDWDLWKGKSELTIDTLIECIEKKSIWKEIETIWKFEDETHVINW